MQAEMRIRITGVAVVFNNDDELVTDRELLSRFDGYVYDEERFTDYLGGSPEEDSLVALVAPGGHISFNLDEASPTLEANTEYKASRELSEAELKLLFDYTLGQWDDGIGENIATETGVTLGLSIQCQTDEPTPSISQTRAST